MPRERVANKRHDIENGVAFFDFLGKANAEGKRPVMKTLTCPVSEIGFTAAGWKALGPVARHLVINGIHQKVGDSYADSAGEGTPFDNASDMWGQLKAGTWAQRGGGGERSSYLLRALCELYDGKHKGFDKFTEEEIRDYLEGLSDAEKKALPANAAVAPIIARMKAEDATAKATAAADAAKGKAPVSPLAGLVKKGANAK